MPCQGISPLRKIAAGFSAAIFATKACRAPGLVASVSDCAVKRISPYATNTSGSGRSPSGTLNVVAACAGPARKAPATAASISKTTGKEIRIARCYAKEAYAAMRCLVLTVLCALSAVGAVEAGTGQDARWRQHAENVRIVRDNWGIAHVYGKSDGDAVFGMIYAQAEDDFGRIERNYLNGLGLLALAEGETAVYTDLRERLFSDPHGFAIAPRRSASGHALLWINPHTSYYFRSELQMVSEQGLNVYGAVTWGQFFVYQGFNTHNGWMHTSYGGDAIDEYAETIVRKPDGLYYRYCAALRKLQVSQITIAFKQATRTGCRKFIVYHSHHGPIVHTADA